MDEFEIGNKVNPANSETSCQEHLNQQEESGKSTEQFGMQHDLSSKLCSRHDVPTGASSTNIYDNVSSMHSGESNEDEDTTHSITFIEELDTYGSTAVNEKTDLKIQYPEHYYRKQISTGNKEVKHNMQLNVHEMPVLLNKLEDNTKIESVQQSSTKQYSVLENSCNVMNKLEIVQQDEISHILNSKCQAKETFDIQEPIINEDFSISISSHPAITSADNHHTLTSSRNKRASECRSVISSDTGETNRISKEFTVVPVSEADLATDKKNAILSEVAEKDLEKTSLLFKKEPCNLSEGEINNQDTIGPLENPAFLRTLNYTESHDVNPIAPISQDISCLRSSEDLSTSSSQENPDVDKGWAWVILAASFFSFSLLGATAYAAGVFMGAIRNEIDPDLTKVAWVGSVNVCFTYLTGPIVGVVRNKLGARLTVILAGLLVSLGFVGAAFSTTVSHLILTHGVLAGIGAGYTLNPMFVTIGQYFDKYRGIACGLLACGTGFGILTGGTIVSLLLEAYGLRGTYLIWAGLMLHLIPSGMFLRPLRSEGFRNCEKENFSKDISEPLIHVCSVGNSVMSFINSCEGSQNQSMMSGLDKIGVARKNVQQCGERETPLLKSLLMKRAFSSSLLLARQESQDLPPLAKSSKSNYSKFVRHHHSSASSTNPSACPSPMVGVSHLAKCNVPLYSLCNYRPLSEMALPALSLTSQMAHSSPVSVRGQLLFRHSSGYHRGCQSYCSSLTHINRLRPAAPGTSTCNVGEHDNISCTSTTASRFHKRGLSTPRYLLRSGSVTTFMGSIMSVPGALAMVNEDLSKDETKISMDSHSKSLKEQPVFCNSLQIFHKRFFVIFIIISFFWAIGESPVIVYMPSYAIEKGTSVMQASSLYTTMGIGSILGRFLSSIASNDVNIGAAPLFTVHLFLAGALIVVSPIFTHTFLQQMIFSGLMGLYTGGLVPLSSIIILEMLNATELGTGVGFLNLFQGVGYLIGPPLGSFIINFVGYGNCFVASGCILMLTAVGSMTLTIQYHSTIDLDDQMSLTEDLHEGDLPAEFLAVADSNLLPPFFTTVENGMDTRMIDKGDTCTKLPDIAETVQRPDREDDKLCTIKEIVEK